jgi:hypothetical protein
VAARLNVRILYSEAQCLAIQTSAKRDNYPSGPTRSTELSSDIRIFILSTSCLPHRTSIAHRLLPQISIKRLNPFSNNMSNICANCSAIKEGTSLPFLYYDYFSLQTSQCDGCAILDRTIKSFIHMLHLFSTVFLDNFSVRPLKMAHNDRTYALSILSQGGRRTPAGMGWMMDGHDGYEMVFELRAIQGKATHHTPSILLM